jgi:hypothetical protein
MPPVPRLTLIAALLALCAAAFCVVPGATRHSRGSGGGSAPNSADPPGKIPPQRQPERRDDVPPTLDEINKLTAYDFDPQYGKALDGFTLWLVDDLGQLIRGVPDYIRLEGRDMEFGAYHLVIYIRDAPSITDMLFYVRYDQDHFHPRQIEPGSAFGFEGDRLWVQKMDIPGVAIGGVARINPDRNGGTKLDDGVVAEVVFEKRPFDYKPVGLTHPPRGEMNRARAIQVYIDDNRTGDRGALSAPSRDVVIYWEEANNGDYNNDGYVSMADIVPVSRRYGRRTVDAEEDAWDVMADGNYDTEVNYKDILPLNRNYGAFISGYRVYRRPAGAPRVDEERLPHRTMPVLPLSIHRPKVWDPIRPVAYRYYDRDLPRSSVPRRYTYRVVPYDAVMDQEGDEKASIEFDVSVTDREVELLDDDLPFTGRPRQR